MMHQECMQLDRMRSKDDLRDGIEFKHRFSFNCSYSSRHMRIRYTYTKYTSAASALLQQASYIVRKQLFKSIVRPRKGGERNGRNKGDLKRVTKKGFMKMLTRSLALLSGGGQLWALLLLFSPVAVLGQNVDWKTAVLDRDEIPADVKSAANSVQMQGNTVDILVTHKYIISGVKADLIRQI